MGNWDEFRIEQVISNLLTNALRYGAKSPITVKVYSENGEARVEVRDRGIGISEENQKRIFQQFERVSAKHVVAGLGSGAVYFRTDSRPPMAVPLPSKAGSAKAPCFAFVCRCRKTADKRNL